MRAIGRSLALVLVLAAAVRAEPAADPEREAFRAYRAKDYAGFLSHMRVAYAREPSLPQSIYNLAAAEALAGSPDEAVRLLARLATTGVGFPIEADDKFRGLRERVDFQAEVQAMKANRAPHGRAEPAFALRERDLLTEGVAYDPRTRSFFVSSVRHRKIVAIDERGRQRDFVAEGQDGLFGVFGMAVDPARRMLWAASTAVPQMIGYRPEDKDAAGLFAFDLATGKLVSKYLLPRDGRPHALGDVIVSSAGVAYTTDSESPTVYRVDAPRHRLDVVVDGGFVSLQGLALSPDEHVLYLADYARGLYALTLADRSIARLEPAPTIAATGIDGLYLHRGRLIATRTASNPSACWR
ncbi:MAG TPA: SMP-30/gluconolactonase/LRE family protein [Kofleriaceae bacterium]|jgi:sugar lactone lactonase YvrE|nr:SMP-30/gluconolactonase/LRE family protein [Kofleriaceae bacterium]